MLAAAAIVTPAAGAVQAKTPGPQAASLVESPNSTAVSTQPLVDAQAKVDAKQFLNARRILNTALSAGNLSSQDTSAAKELLNTINRTVVFSPQRFSTDEHADSYVVKSGDRLAKIAAQNEVATELLMRINNIADARRLRAGQTIKLLKGPFHAVVSKSKFTLEIFLGDPTSKSAVYITSFEVGLGKDDATPKGTWMVQPQSKLKNPAYYSPRGEGVISADDPKNPLGEYWIGLEGIDGEAIGKKSYGIHGTIEPESIGKMESLGCIRLKNQDVEQVYEMLVEGKSTVVVTD
ncbi:MAG: L,D-transpeptidase family protein [Gemmatimonadaceae bacterium]|nr:L,D-transpeptidase family protein [Gemmatimonadaceae bacterium]